MIKIQYISRIEASEYLTTRGFKTSHKTLAKYATVGGGPVFHRFGNKRVVYEIAHLDEWISSRLSKPLNSTTEA